jgi:hypothetical protein
MVTVELLDDARTVCAQILGTMERLVQSTLYRRKRRQRAKWYSPECYDYIDEIYRAHVLADTPLRVQSGRRGIHVQDGAQTCALTLVGGVWRGTCHYARTHDPRSRPCCHVRAVELLVGKGALPDLQEMIPVTAGSAVSAQTRAGWMEGGAK